MNAPALPAMLADNPRLDRWVGFPAPGVVAVKTGRVEIGQGALTALLQIAAEELDVAPERIRLQSGDTSATANEGITAGSLSVAMGGSALRAACAEVRAAFLAAAASRLGCDAAVLSVADGAILKDGAASGLDYWALAGDVDLARDAAGGVPVKAAGAYGLVGKSLPRVDLPGKLFGEAVFIHDMVLPGMLHARVVRQPCRGATIAAIDEAALRRAAKGEIEIVRSGDFVALLGEDEMAVERAGLAAETHVTWDGVEAISPQAEDAKWVLQQPTVDAVHGAPEAEAAVSGGQRVEARISRAHLAHASIAPSCALASFRDGKLEVWSHSQGVFPLRAAIASMLKLDPAAVTVRHVQGAGCYGHNGADDVAGDAAAIATLKPGRPIRVRWRREEEFGFEPVSPAMVVNVKAIVGDDGKPIDWTTEIWSGRHSSRPGRSGGNLLAAEALPNPPPAPAPGDLPESAGGGGTRNGTPLYAIPQKRIVHHLITETPVRTSALRGLGTMPNVFAIETLIDELAERAGVDPVAYRLSILDDARAKAVVAHAAKMAAWDPAAPSGTGTGRGIGFARYKNSAAYTACVAEVAVEEEIRVLKVWCATDTGLVVNPDGAINQLEGGIVQSASWVLKEQVRFSETGIASRDWDSYPVLRFSEMPEIFVELVNDRQAPSLGVGEATAGPTAAAIGNAVAHALGVRLRDLPLTRERVMEALLA
jgi:CO/xanthine dehydrogenase Mo-binding subunit